MALEALKPADMTWIEVAKLVGKSENTIHRLKRGESSISVEMIDRLAEVFGVHPVRIYVLAGIVPVELADDGLSAIVGGLLTVPVDLATMSPEDAVLADPTLSDAGKERLIGYLTAERKMRS
ncbi:MAG: helix-turn-helix transcriptional regulator [Terricaulis sp.]